MNYERQKRLVERLLERTLTGELAWQEGIDKNVFQVSFPNYSAKIYYRTYGRYGYQIDIIDSSGNTMDSFSDSNLDGESKHLSGSWAEVMGDLFIYARRKALKADEALDGILAEIG